MKNENKKPEAEPVGKEEGNVMFYQTVPNSH